RRRAILAGGRYRREAMMSPARPGAEGGLISVVMPAHNEEGYLESAVKAVVTGLLQRRQPFEVIVAENGSSDRTGEEAASLAKTFTEVRVLRCPSADYGRALRSGFVASRGTLVANFDVDLVDMEFLDRALEHMEATGAAIVVGSKRGPGSADQRGVGRKLVTAVYSAVLLRGFGLVVSDTHGLKLLRRESLAPLVERCHFGGDIFDTELILRAERAGLIVAEIPVSVSEQRPARTSILRRIPRSLVGLVRLRLALGRLSPDR
ncbi:MAG: glycosyltransferase, partial [Acidimicrobiales bacterium]